MTLKTSNWKEEVLPQKAFVLLQNRCGGWGEGLSQYIRGLVKTQSVLVNYNSYLWFQELEILLSFYHGAFIQRFIAQAASFQGKYPNDHTSTPVAQPNCFFHYGLKKRNWHSRLFEDEIAEFLTKTERQKCKNRI